MHTPRTYILQRSAALAALVLICGSLALTALANDAPEAAAGQSAPVALALVGGAFTRRDAALKQEKALPNGAAAVATDPIDLMHSTDGAMLADVEFLLTAPALLTAALPDTKTMTYVVEHDTASGFGTAATLLPSVIVQTGADGAGAAGATFRFRVPAGCKRYIRVKATNSGAGNASGVKMTLEPLF